MFESEVCTVVCVARSLNNNFITTLEAGSFSNLPSLHYL